MSQSSDLKGIGGWLLVLIVCVGIIGPISGVYDGLSNFQEAELKHPDLLTTIGWRHYKLASWALFAVVCTLRIAAAVRLAFACKRSAVRFAIAVMLLCPAFVAISDFLLLVLFLGTNVAASAASTLLVDFGKQLVYWALWSWYLLRSVRVANTYGVRPNNSFNPKPLRGSA